ncbi:hypothetical protein [Burkholderia multivorans]|uniref:hypothetical protein n=1 Tax=Burkholderia multivorans TaxID=87883 RepID=UPI0021BE59C7|nr:hypothetical protein [Burkholderia multivorans]MDR9051730.1 hypothetical protein [Burkholderia multivorans]MDR9057732.1 hypothetical protein [Burkholderia multivorans]MDR9064643.1 hypothetical protein [Burkholderia multivorans]MDR9069746.1 hypothetical protein [Burkholderia multivorans]MDR9076826.1 hypothetical protein [Burkholderia multivorans]
MSYQLKQFTQDEFEKTRAEWSQYLESHDMFDLEYKRALDSAEGNREYTRTADNEFAYGVFHDGAQTASAIVSMVHSRRGGRDVGWLKMLQVDLAPEFDEVHVQADLDRLRQVIDIYFAAIVGTVKLGAVHPAKVLKLYGRSTYLLQMLVSVAEKLQQDSANLHAKVSMEGRWLVIRAE